LRVAARRQTAALFENELRLSAESRYDKVGEAENLIGMKRRFLSRSDAGN